MLLPQPATAFSPIDFKQAAVARDQLFNSQYGHYNRDKVDLEQLSPGQPVRVQNESIGLWDLTGEVIDIRPDKLSYIEGRTFVWGPAKIKPVFKVGFHEAKEGGVPAESESHLDEGVFPVGSDTSDNSDLQSTVNSAPPLRRSSRLLEKCVPSSSSVSACGLSSGVGAQHVPFSYSLPCPALVPDAEEKLRKRNSMNLGKWPSSTGITHMRTSLTGPTLASRCSTFNGPVLLPEFQPCKLSRSSVLPLSSAAFGRPRLEGDDAKTRNICLRPSAPSVPQPMSLPRHQLPPGPMFRPPPLLLSQAQIGSGLRQDGPVFPHHIMQDRVVFQGSRTPSYRHCYTTGPFRDVDIPPVDRQLKCGPFQPLPTMLEPRMEPCLGSQSSKTTMTGTGGQSPPGLHVDAPLLPAGNHYLARNLPPRFSQAQPRQQPQDTLEEESIRQGSSPPPISACSKILPRESIKTFNDCKSAISGNVHIMKVRF